MSEKMRRKKRERNELLYFWAGVVNCECMLNKVT